MLEFYWESVLWNLIMILLNVVVVYKKLPVSGSLWLRFGIIVCDPCFFIMICLSKFVCVSISSTFVFCLLAFLWYLPSSIVFCSLPECLATLITDYSVCLLLCYLACHTFQGYFVVSFLFHLGMFPVPFSKVYCCLPSGSPYFLRVQCLSFASSYTCSAIFLWWRLSQPCRWRFQGYNAV